MLNVVLPWARVITAPMLLFLIISPCHALDRQEDTFSWVPASKLQMAVLPPWELAFSGDGRYLGYSASNGMVTVWDVGLKKEIFKFQSPGLRVNRISLNRDGSALLTLRGTELEKPNNPESFSVTT
jgi:hypothetical protein